MSAAAPTTAGRAGGVLRDMTARPSGAIGLALIVVHLALALLSPWLAPYDYRGMDATNTLADPSALHWLGTDHLGRDVLSRVMLGGREALLITGIATPVAMLWGGLTGVWLGLRGGWPDELAMRLVDAFLALPGIRDTVSIDHIKRGYHSIKALNPTGLVPVGPELPVALRQ